MTNFIDYNFVQKLFDDKYLLKKIEPGFQRIIVDNIIPKFEVCTKSYGTFYESQL